MFSGFVGAERSDRFLAVWLFLVEKETGGIEVAKRYSKKGTSQCFFFLCSALVLHHDSHAWFLLYHVNS